MSIINIKNLSFNYDGSHDNIFENVNLQIDTNWKLGLVGRNGKGKTTLLKLLLGDLEYRGNIQSSVKFEYFPFSINNKDISVYEAIKIIDSNYEEWKILKELTLLDFYDIDFYRPFSTYSNGEQTKIMLAVLFSKDNSFLLIDEPTNHLDRKGREVLAKYLSRKSSYIIVSHDKMFLDNCIDHVMSINRENIELQNGNLSSYLENKNYQDAYEFSENEKLKTEIARLEESTKRTKDWANKNESTKIGFDPTKVEKNIGRRAYVGSKTKKMMKQSKVLEQRNNKAIAEKSLLLKNIDREETLKIQGVEFFK
jgi:lincosamide and streptogramin A transport system ATP-binding/permease protein